MIGDLRPYPAYLPSGVPWLEQVPEHWDVRALKRWCDRSSLYGANIPASEYALDGVRFLRTSDITVEGALRPGGVYISREAAAGYELSEGDLLISRSGTIGRSFRYRASVHGPSAYAGYLVRFVAGRNLAPDYLFYFTKTSAFDEFVRVAVVSSTIENLSGEKYGNMPVPLPPVDEQAAIVRFVDHADRQIRRYMSAKQKLVKLLEEQRQGIISVAITRGLDGSVPFRSAGIQDAGDVPSHWLTRAFTRCAVEIADYRGATPTKTDEGVFLVTARNVRRGWIDYETSREYVAAEDYAAIMRRGLPHIGDLLLTMEAPLGHAALVDREDVALAQRVVRFRLDPALLVPEFALHSVLAPYFQNQLLRRGTGSTAVGIKASKLPQLLLLCPPLAEQRDIVARIASECEPMERAVERARREISYLVEYRTRLISDVVTGKLDVRLAASALPDMGSDLLEEYDEAAEDDGRDSIEDVEGAAA